MFTKLLTNVFLLIVLCKTYTNCRTIESDSQQNSQNNKKTIIKQWNQWPGPNQWPNSQFNLSQWPSATWIPPVSSYPWPRPTGDTPTKYPPLPGIIVNWSTKPPSELSTDSSPSDIISTDETTTTTTKRPYSTQRPYTTQRPVTKPPQSTNSPIEDPSKITVKSCGMSRVPHSINGNKIVEGKKAQIGAFPWQVVLKIQTSRGTMQCGGAVLNSKWVITAAHCVSNERDGTPTAQSIELTAGTVLRSRPNTGFQKKSADCVIQHEGWRGQTGSFKNDIALLRLPASNCFEINYEKNPNINGICLPEKALSEYSGSARIAGWGLKVDKGQASDELLYTDVSLLPNDKCRKYQYPVPIAESMICQGVDRKAPCQGDSGGALVVPISDQKGVQRMVEIGIVSFGPGQCANPSIPNAIYTKVSHFLSWIDKTIKANEQRCSRPLRMNVEKIGEGSENDSNSTVTENTIFF